MAVSTNEIELFQPTNGSADAILRECTADARALNKVFGLPAVVERLDTQFSFTMNARADRLFKLEDGSLWHVEWQSSRDADMFKRMIEYWIFVRNKVDPKARIRSTVILVGKAPRDWVIEDWLGAEKVQIPVVDFRTLDVAPLFEEGNTSDMLIGILDKDGARAENLTKVVSTVLAEQPSQRDRLLSILGRMIELRGEPIALPQGVYEMIEALDIDYEKNPVFRRPFERGRSAERRSNALNLLEIARPGRSHQNEQLVAGFPDEKIDALIAAVYTALKARTAEALKQLDETIDPQP